MVISSCLHAGQQLAALLDRDGRTITISAPGLSIFRGGFSATVVRNGEQLTLCSDRGAVSKVTQSSPRATCYGMADEVTSRIYFEKEQVELLLCLDILRERPVVLLQAGIHNVCKTRLNLQEVCPLTMRSHSEDSGNGAPPWSLQVVDMPKDWLITGLHPSTPVDLYLSENTAPVNIFEYGGLYHGEQLGFLFGPVGNPVSYVSAVFTPQPDHKTSLTFCSSMDGVSVNPGQTRWGQQMGLFFEAPAKAMRNWADCVAQTHGRQIAKGALSGFSDTQETREKTTGREIFNFAGQVVSSSQLLRPGLIQFDPGNLPPAGASVASNTNFPEGLSYYARLLGTTGARPAIVLNNLNLSDFEPVRHAAKDGFTAVQVEQWNCDYRAGGTLTLFEKTREFGRRMREAAGPGIYIRWTDPKSSRAMVGFVDSCRTGFPLKTRSLRPLMDEVLRSYHLNGRWYAVDNDNYFIGTQLPDFHSSVGEEGIIRTWMSMVGLSCGMAVTSDLWDGNRLMPQVQHVEIMSPPALEQTQVFDLCLTPQCARLIGHVTREWGSWTVALLWNPGEKEALVGVNLDQIGLDPNRTYAVWSFWDNLYLGAIQKRWSTRFLAPATSQHLCFTELPPNSSKPVLIGSNLHIYCGAAEIKRITTQNSRIQIELTDAGARAGDLFIYSRIRPVLKESQGCAVTGITSAGENVWKVSLQGRSHDQAQLVDLVIPIPIIQQPWFWVLCMLILLSLVFAWWRYLVWTRLQHELKLEQERSRIARDLHDELGAGLSEIAMLSEVIREDLRQPGVVEPYVERISDSASEMTQTLDEIVWAINPMNDTLEKFISFVCEFAQAYLQPAGIHCRLDMPGEVTAMEVNSTIRHQLCMALKECLHNVVKHAHAQEVRIRITMEALLLNLRVADDGIGFVPDLQSNPSGTSDGLSNLRQRMAAIDGRCEIYSEPGRGTIVLLQVKI